MKVLQIDKNHPLIIEQLSEKGFVIDEDFTSTYDEVLSKIDQYEGLIIRSRIPLDAHFLTKAKHLKFIARVGAGMENIDKEVANQHDIVLINSPEGNRDAVAEHVVGMLLSLTNRLVISSDEVKNGIWLREENRGEELKTKTFGIIGYGFMGKAVAERLKGFGMEVVFHDIVSDLEDENARQISLEEFKDKVDIVSLHVPLTPETNGFMNADFFNEMKHDFYLINTARGKNVVTKDVVNAIEQGKIKGVALDVLEYEKSSFEKLENFPEELQYLLDSDKAIITPHIAGWTHESKIKLAQVIVDKIVIEFC